MTPADFVAKWKASKLTEKAAAQSQFIDLCHLLEEPTPSESDPSGETYAFEKGASKTTGAGGWADVWKADHFAWEYKSKGKDLNAAFAQLQQYCGALGNPPLLVVSDMHRFRIHTAWTNTVSVMHELTLDDLLNPEKLQLLKWVLSDPDKLKPGKTRQALTEEAAEQFAMLAQRLRERGFEAQRVAHFVNRMVFCMFAEDVDLLPDRIFQKMLEIAALDPDQFVPMAKDLFGAMGTGGSAGWKKVAWFNGGLFDDDEALPLDKEDVQIVLGAARLDWSDVDPSIFGTLFERGLDPDKRSQWGMHYTDRDKIMLVIEPVVTRPLLIEWNAVKSQIEKHLKDAEYHKARRPRTQAEARKVYAAARRAEEAAYRKASKVLSHFLSRLRALRVLDPACGSGNFLYLALLALKDLEHRAIIEAEALGFERSAPSIGPENILGIENNPYAAELARVSIWIGEIQWMKRNGFTVSRSPILKTLDNILCRDAVVNEDGSEFVWPDADLIVGNPPWLGDRYHLRELGEEYTAKLRHSYRGRVPGRADLACYWVQKAVEAAEKGTAARFGFVTTKGVTKGASRKALDAVDASPDLVIFDAWTNEPWVLKGAKVRSSIFCISRRDRGYIPGKMLNGTSVENIGPDLTEPVNGMHISHAPRLPENRGVAFQGVKLTGSFDITGEKARELLVLPKNPNGKSNSDVVRRLWDIDDVVGRDSDRWVIDFGVNMDEDDACLYEKPFEKVKKVVPEQRKDTREERVKKNYWLFQRPRPRLRAALSTVRRYIVTPESSEHRIFVWATVDILIVGSLFAIARADDTSFGVLHSKFHEAWSTRKGNRLGAGNQRRYNITETFETFPFPDGLTPNIPAADYASDPRAEAIATAARRLDTLRRAWLNPSDLVDVVPEVVPGFPDRLVPKDDKAAAILKKRTLTNLYNERPAWLAKAHADLDAAVAAAYGWPADISEDDALARLLALNAERASTAASKSDDKEKECAL